MKCFYQRQHLPLQKERGRRQVESFNAFVNLVEISSSETIIVSQLHYNTFKWQFVYLFFLHFKSKNVQIFYQVHEYVVIGRSHHSESVCLKKSRRTKKHLWKTVNNILRVWQAIGTTYKKTQKKKHEKNNKRVVHFWSWLLFGFLKDTTS